MEWKKHYSTLVLMLLLTQASTAYNASKTYYLNETAGAIFDETIDTTHHNTLITITLPEIVILAIILLSVGIPAALFLLLVIYALKRLHGGRDKNGGKKR